MKLLLYFFSATFLFVGSCSQTRHSVKIDKLKSSIIIKDTSSVIKYANTITSEELKKTVYEFASSKFMGRATGELGQHKAANFIKDFYISNGIKSPLSNNNYLQSIPKEFFEGNVSNDSENVLAFIEGKDKPEEIIIISAHLDHEGIIDEKLYPGADDNGSGTSAVLEIAQAFKEASDNGYAPKRSILFFHSTGEEIGLYGSRYYSQNPVFPLENTVANLNLDMIGRVDDNHQDNPEYLYLIGSDRLSTELHYVSEKVNNTFTKLTLDYMYNDENDRNRFYYRSDHYNFAKHNIPCIFYFSGIHEDYTKPTDTPDKLNYKLLEKRTKLIFATAWQLANQENRLIVDKAKK